MANELDNIPSISVHQTILSAGMSYL